MNEAPERQVQCEKCRATFLIPNLSPVLRSRIVELIRNDHRAEATRQLKISGGIELSAAKAVVLHITWKKNQCNRCRKPIPESDEIVCPNCGALNLNW